MTLYTRSIFLEPQEEDGLRISVMSRHTQNDGVTPDSRITEQSFDRWFKIFAPPSKLVGAHYRKELDWEGFTTGYKEHLRTEPVARKVRALARLAKRRDLTILCVESEASECHRGILAEECQRYVPDLEVIHRSH